MISPDFDHYYNMERKYKCPCGLSYLSNSALYTHIKFKHRGHAPGEVIKPERKPINRARGGRRRGSRKQFSESHDSYADSSSYNKIQDDSVRDEYPNLRRKKETVEKQIIGALSDFKASSKTNFQTSTGNETCQDIASLFYRKYSPISYKVQIGLSLMLSELETAVNSKHGEGFWKNSPPDEIVDCANLTCQMHSKDSPLERNQLIKLLLIFFKWLYDENWTDHELQRKVTYFHSGLTVNQS